MDKLKHKEIGVARDIGVQALKSLGKMKSFKAIFVYSGYRFNLTYD